MVKIKLGDKTIWRRKDSGRDQDNITLMAKRNQKDLLGFSHSKA